ncbi:MAG: 50S ribosomal protein L25 [Chthoniobacterales bacterium]
MAQSLKLSAKPRTSTGSNAVKKLRAQDLIPAVIYSNKQDAENLELSRKEVETLLSHAAGESLLVELNIEGKGEQLSLIQEVQHHVVTRNVLHVDFHAVSATEEIEAEIPLEPHGEPVGVKNYGGVLQQNIHALNVRCLPQNLPQIITVDVSELGLGESLHISQIALPKGVEATADGELSAFIVTEPRVSETTQVEGETASEPEVIAEKKEESKTEDSK